VVTLNTENPNLVSTPARSQLMRALVVDTDPKQIKTLLLLLRKEGFEAKGCTTAAEALSIIRKMDIGIVVIDLRLPDIQGSHLVECLLEKTRAIKAIIHTAYGSFAVAKEVINHGAFAFVEKRDDSRELIRQVHRAAESRLNQYAEELEEAVAQRTAELTLSQKWMESLVRSVHGVLWEFDVPTSRFTYVSEQAEHLLGYPPQQWITDPTFFQDHLHPEDRNWVLTYCQQMTTYKKDHEFEYRMMAKDGGIVWIYDLVTVIIENDRPVKLQGVLIDITKRKRTEEALRESEAKFQDLYDYAPDMMASVDLRTASILHCNETLVTATGYTKKELINRPIFEMYHPDSLEEARQCFQSFKETGEIHNAELQLKRKDGSTIDVMLNLTAVRDDQGRIQHSRSIWRDITERKQATKALHDSELRSRTLLEGSPVCTKIIDLDSRLQYMSTAGQVYLKIADIEPFYGCTFPSDFYPESVRASIVEHLERAKLGETSSVECPVLDTKGNEVWFHTTFVPARDDDGRIKYIIVTSVNITERKNIEERERSAQRLIAAVSDVQARFIGDQKLHMSLRSSSRICLI